MASRGYDVKDCGLSVWLSFGSTEAIIPTTNRSPLHLKNPHHYHDTPRCVCLINRRNRMEDRLLFGARGWDWHCEELSVKSAGCPRISSVVTQPHAPWRSFRQLSRTRPAAVLNSSLQRPTPDEQLQAHWSISIRAPPPPPHFLSLTPRLLMPAGILTVLMNITPPHHLHHHHPKHTVLCDEKFMACSLYCPPLKHKEKQAPLKDNSACQSFAWYLPLSTVKS